MKFQRHLYILGIVGICIGVVQVNNNSLNLLVCLSARLQNVYLPCWSCNPVYGTLLIMSIFYSTIHLFNYLFIPTIYLFQLFIYIDCIVSMYHERCSIN